MDRPLVSVLIPCFNEEEGLGPCLDSLFEPELARECEWLVIDGRSTDSTRLRAQEAGRRIPNLRLMDNPARLQAHGLNLGLEAARGRYLVRADAHALYPPGYLKGLLALLAETGAQNAGGMMLPRGKGIWGRAAAAAMSHPLGVGDALFHLGGFRGEVDTLYLGSFPAEVFETVGPFDPQAHPNEDAELNLRLRRAGGRIFLDSALQVAYQPRDSLGRLARQYYHYGRGRAYTSLKHRRLTSPRQLVPPLLLLGLAASLGGSLFWPPALLAPAAYLAGLALAALPHGQASGDGLKGWLALGLAFAAMHLCWAAGFLGRLLGPWPRKWTPGRRFERKT